MNHRLAVLLLLCTALSGCASFEPYRRDLSPGFACAVDLAAITAKVRTLCESPRDAASEPHALQHRHYSSRLSVTDKDGKVRSDPREVRDYHLAFVEFDDQGWFADRGQIDRLFALLETLRKQNREVLIHVYAHGWKHNAHSCDSNVVCFSRLLERTDLVDKKLYGSERAVVGVYLGWRGLPFDTALNNISFWSRKAAAARVGTGSVLEILTRLRDYRDGRRSANPKAGKKTQLVITGHSFGDFVMLVNPAFEGSLYEPLFGIAVNRCYPATQRPVMMIVTSESDSATRVAFPAGRWLDTLFEHAGSPVQGDAMRTAVGHSARYRTHRLASDGIAQAIRDESACGCPYLDPTAASDQSGLLRFLDSTMRRQLAYKTASKAEADRLADGLVLRSEAGPASGTLGPGFGYAARFPYLVVQADAGVIDGHNAIYSERFVTFAQQFLLFQIEQGFPVPGDLEKPACWRPRDGAPQPGGGLLPAELSCVREGGRSCALP